MTPSRFHHRVPQDHFGAVELAFRINSHGFAASERQLEHFARRLASEGRSPLLTELMLDRASPPIVRERAFARAFAALRRTRAERAERVDRVEHELVDVA